MKDKGREREARFVPKVFKVFWKAVGPLYLHRQKGNIDISQVSTGGSKS